MAKSVIQHLFPNGNFILGHLHHNADRLHSMSLLMKNLVREEDNGKCKELTGYSSKLLVETKHESRALFETLSKNLITPFDREDIFALGSGLKSLCTKTDSLIRYLEQNKCGASQQGLVQLTDSFEKATEALLRVIHGLEKFNQQKTTYESVLDLREHYNFIDHHCELCLVECFETLESIKEILINIDIYDYFGALTEKLKEMGQVAESFLVKYA